METYLRQFVIFEHGFHSLTKHSLPGSRQTETAKMCSVYQEKYQMLHRSALWEQSDFPDLSDKAEGDGLLHCVEQTVKMLK